MSRPRDADAAITKQRILSAASQCFAESGFSGTSMRTIAKRAGVSQPLVQRYFGGKHVLFEAVLERALHDYTDAQSSFWELPDDDARFFVEGLAGLFAWMGERSELLRLGVWARLEGYTVTMQPIDAYWARLSERIVAGQRAGLIRADADPDTALLLIDAMVKGYWERRHSAVSAVWSRDDLDQRAMLTAVSFAVRGLLEPEHAEPALELLRQRLDGVM